MIRLCDILVTEDGKHWVSLEDYKKLLEEYEAAVGVESNEQIIKGMGEDEIPD